MVVGNSSGIALLYHDVVARDNAQKSGIITDGSWRYKLSPEMFRAHLQRIDTSQYHVSTLPDINSDHPLLLTFDDGGVSCIESIAPSLEANDMRGNFFVITGRLGDDGYLTRQQVRTLADAGHHIGSHTVSHANLRTLSPSARRRELRKSKRNLEELLGTDCVSVSIPGGFANGRVMADAVEIGYDYVFLSDPRYLSLPASDGPIGRWNIWHDTTVEALSQILNRSLRTRLRIQGRWYALKAVKRAIGQEQFERIRNPFVSRK